MADLFVMPSTGEGFGIVFGLGIARAKDALADGQLGTLTSEAKFAITIARLVVNPKLDPSLLAAVACERFGRETFAVRACTVLNRLIEAT